MHKRCSFSPVAAFRTAALLAGAVLGASVQVQSGAPSQEPQRPVFRVGTNLVRVDDLMLGQNPAPVAPSESALAELKRLRPGAAHARHDHWRRTCDHDGAALGDPLLYRLATPTSPRPAGSPLFRRTERIRIQWPLSAIVEEPPARLLGRDGAPLELAVAPSEREEAGVKFHVADLNLAPLTAGDYVIEVVGTAGRKPETAMFAFRVGR